MHRDQSSVHGDPRSSPRNSDLLPGAGSWTGQLPGRAMLLKEELDPSCAGPCHALGKRPDEVWDVYADATLSGKGPMRCQLHAHDERRVAVGRLGSTWPDPRGRVDRSMDK